MSENINDTAIGTPTEFYADKIWEGTLLPNAGTITSPFFDFAQTLGKIEAKLFANTAFTLPESVTIVVEFLNDAGDVLITRVVEGLTGGTVFETGDLILGYVAGNEITDVSTQVSVTTTTDLSAGSVDLGIYQV